MAVRTVPHRVPYIHPSQRTLTSNQIGPSAHKNAYHVGVLDGNWSEDRAAFDQQPMQAGFAGTSTMKTSYQAPPAGTLRGPSCELVPAARAEMEKAAFFSNKEGHALLTSNELFYSDLAEGPALKTDQVIKINGQSGRHGFVARKRAQWAEETNPWNWVKTTKGTTIDASAVEATKLSTRRDGTAPHHIDKWGGVARDLSMPYHSLQLREHIPLLRSPFA